MKTVENQKVVQISLEKVEKASKGTKRPYIVKYNDTLNEAIKSFTTIGEIKLYLYLCQNSDGGELAFSPADVSNCMNVSLNTVRTAFNALMEKGYIWLKKGNKYQFTDKSILTGKICIPIEGSNQGIFKTWEELLTECEGDRAAALEIWKEYKPGV